MRPKAPMPAMKQARSMRLSSMSGDISHRDSPKSRAQPIARPKRSEMSVRKRSLSDFAWACIMLNKG